MQEPNPILQPRLAAEITRAASSQTYQTIRFLVDASRVKQAYQAYAYFRWLDDSLDSAGMQKPERLALLHSQEKLMVTCYRGETPAGVSTQEENFLVELIRSDTEANSGLRAYIWNMMAVMSFDAERRGRLISADELSGYTHHLAVAVTEAMHHFIGHDRPAPAGAARYQAVSAAHIAHMLRDTLEDVQAGYYNIPAETLQALRIDPRDVTSAPYRQWVRGRVALARACFQRGREQLSSVPSARCRLAGFAYSARFEDLLTTIEQDDYRLRLAYPEVKGFSGVSRMLWSALAQTFGRRAGFGLAFPAGQKNP